MNPPFQIVLVEPEIPLNTGNIARLCAATRSVLHLVGPLGFNLEDKQMKRAGMDYWRHVTWHRWGNWTEFDSQLPKGARLWLIESGGPRHYGEADYRPGDYLVFGRETLGLPRALLEEAKERWLRLPMFHETSRSLNLSNCVAVVLFEALRQTGFQGEVLG